jgi:hypothetical protein
MTDAQKLAEAFEIAEKIEEIVSGTLRDEPGTDKCDQCEPWQRVARIAGLNGRLIAITRPEVTPDEG